MAKTSAKPHAKKGVAGFYAVGYGKPPKHSQFPPGTSGNPKGGKKAPVSAQALLLEEAAKLVKVKSGDKIVEVPRMRALMRKLLDLGLQGNIAAIRLALVYLSTAYAETQAAHPQEAPLTEDELAVLKLFASKAEQS